MPIKQVVNTSHHLALYTTHPDVFIVLLIGFHCPIVKRISLISLRLGQSAFETELLGDNGTIKGFPGGTVEKNPPANAGDTRDTGLIPGLGRSPGKGYGNPLQYPCLENSMTEEPAGLQSFGQQRVGRD